MTRKFAILLDAGFLNRKLEAKNSYPTNSPECADFEPFADQIGKFYPTASKSAFGRPLSPGGIGPKVGTELMSPAWMPQYDQIRNRYSGFCVH